jgi:hypothetical protein
MATVDWQRPEHDLPKEGWHFVRVGACKEKRSKNGDLMFEVELVDADFGGKLLKDWLMLEGKMWGAGKHALIALGLGDKPEIAEMDVVGKTAYVYVKHEERLFKDNRTGKEVKRMEAKVAKDATDPWCGYSAQDKIPEGFEPSTPF